MLHLQAWPVMTDTFITLTGLYKINEEVTRRQVGGLIVNTALFALPSLQQTAYGVFQESLKGWRELTHPK